MVYDDEYTSGSKSMKEQCEKIRQAHLQAPEEAPQVSGPEAQQPKEVKGIPQPKGTRLSGEEIPEPPTPKAMSDEELERSPYELLGDEVQAHIKEEMSADDEYEEEEED